MPKQSKESTNFDSHADFLGFDSLEKRTQEGAKTTELEKRIQAKYDKEERYPWLSEETMRIKDIHSFLHCEILDFVRWIEPTEAQKEERHLVVKRIKRVVKEIWPNAVVMVFGSVATGLNLPKSDIDLLVYHTDVRELKMLDKLSTALFRSGYCKSIEALKHTKVPLIKMVDKHSNVNVDISFNRTNGIYCVKLVKYLQKKYPELRPLILVLKAFLKSRSLNETYHGGVGSFLLTMLVTSYLQRQYKLSHAARNGLLPQRSTD